MSKKADKSSLKIALFFAIIMVIFVYINNSKIGDQILPLTKEFSAENFIYDTDQRNDRFIKGELSGEKLRMLDKILIHEKQNYQMRLSGDVLMELAQNDDDLIRAYTRWRKCYDMMRSNTHVVYPDERSSVDNIK